MAEEIKVNIPNIHISDVESIFQKIKSVTGKEDVEISFEFMIATFFPSCWENIRSEMNRQYTMGYLAGRKDSKTESERGIALCSTEDDADCFCD